MVTETASLRVLAVKKAAFAAFAGWSARVRVERHRAREKAERGQKWSGQRRGLGDPPIHPPLARLRSRRCELASFYRAHTVRHMAEDSLGLSSLLTQYDTRITSLKSLLALRGLSSEHHPTREALEQIALQIGALEADIGVARGQLVAEAALLAEAAVIQRRAARSASDVSSMAARLPAHLPGTAAAPHCADRVPLRDVAPDGRNRADFAPSTTAKQPAAISAASATQPPPPPPPPPPDSGVTPASAAASAASCTSCSSSSSSSSSSRPASARNQPPQIALLTDAELRTAPSYMRSRIDVAKVNAAVSDVQRLLAAKYSSLAAAAAQVRAMHEVERRKHSAWKLGETPELRGVHFFDENDLASLTHIRNDATGKGLLAVLRHVGRLKEFKHKSTGLRCWRVM